MRFLLTGGAGYIGSHTCVSLLDAGHEVVVLDNFVNSCPEAIARVEKIAGKPITLYEGDCCDAAFVSSVFDKEHIDGVVHFAGLKAVGESVRIPLNYYQNNLGATMTLCRVMAEHHVKRIVFSSSATVYGDSKEVPFNESLPMGECTNPYGWTKWMSERIMRDIAFADPEWTVVLLRYFNPVGAHESGLLGERPNGIPNNLMPYVTQTAAGLREYLSVFGNDYPTPDGTGVRDFIHVVDLARGHLAALDYGLAHTGCEAFNLGTGRGYSVLELVKVFEAVNGVRVPCRIAPRRAGDLACVYADPRRAEALLGWRAEKTLEDMCRDAWRFQMHLKEE